MYIDSFTTWLDTGAKWVLMANKGRLEITSPVQHPRHLDDDFRVQLGDQSVEFNDPMIDTLDLIRRYHEYVDTHTLANFLVTHGGHEFLWGRTVRKVDTWTAADGVWFQVVFADNGECQRISSNDPYIRGAGEGRHRGDFIGFYLDFLKSSSINFPRNHDFVKLIRGDPFLRIALKPSSPDLSFQQALDSRCPFHIWQWQHPVEISIKTDYRLCRQFEGPVWLESTSFRDD